MWKIPTSTDCLTLLDGSGDFNNVDLWAPQVGNCNPSPLPRVQVYIYIYMRMMIFIHIMFVLVVFNTWIYIYIYRYKKYILKIISIKKGLTDPNSDSFCKETDQKIAGFLGVHLLLPFSEQGTKKQRHGNLTWYPTKPGSSALLWKFTTRSVRVIVRFLNCRAAWLKFWEVVICGGCPVLGSNSVACSCCSRKNRGRWGLIYSEPSSSLMRSLMSLA